MNDIPSPSLSHSCWLAAAGVKRSLKELREKGTLHHFPG